MKLLFRFDDEGFYVEPVLSHEVDRFNIQPDRLTDISPPDFIRAKFENGQWVEGADDEYMESITPKPETNPLNIVMEQNAFLTMELAETKLANDFLMNQQAELLLLVANNLSTPPPVEEDSPSEQESPIENPPSPESPDNELPNEEIPVDESPSNSDEDNQPETEQLNYPIEEGEVK